MGIKPHLGATLAVGAVEHFLAFPSDRHSHPKGLQALALSLAAISPVLGEAPAPQCQQPCPGGHSGATTGWHRAAPQPSTQLTQLPALYISALTEHRDCPLKLTLAGANPPWHQWAGGCVVPGWQLVAAAPGAAGAKPGASSRREGAAAHKACPQKPREQCRTAYRKQSFRSFPWTWVATPGRREGVSHARADVWTYVRLNSFLSFF